MDAAAPLRQVVHALADPASKDRPCPPLLAGDRSPGLHLVAQPDLVAIAVCSPREQNGIARRKRGARTQTSDLADVLAVSRDANAVLCWPGDANRCFSAPRDQKRTTWSADEQTMALAASRLRGPNQTRVRRAWNAGWFHHA